MQNEKAKPVWILRGLLWGGFMFLVMEIATPFADGIQLQTSKVLMKLINRETGNNCYEIIKEYKGGLTARLYQTVAFFFNSSLKQPYNAAGDDADIERIVHEVQRMYGYPVTYMSAKSS